MCQKWTLIGAFYPFARNHNAIGSEDQEPYRFSTDAQNNMRTAIQWRYALLRYYYTQMYVNSIEGGMFWKPLFFEFPDDPKVNVDMESNIMIGPALKLSAFIEEKDARNRKYVFPKGAWCNIVTEICTKYYNTGTTDLDTTPDQLHLHLRMGHILPLQPEAVGSVMATSDLEQYQTTLYSKETFSF